MSKNKALVYASPAICIISALLLYFSFSGELSFLVFVCFVPVFYTIEYIQNKKKSFINVLLFLLIWNIFHNQFLLLYMLSFSSFAAVAFSFIVLLMLAALQILPFIFLIFNIKYKYVLFISLWILTEYFLLSFIKFPFLNLGNTLGAFPALIQWYQYTGVSGGTLWILLINTVLFQIIIFSKSREKVFKPLLSLIVLVVIPVVISVGLYNKSFPKNKARTVRILNFKSKTEGDDLLAEYTSILKSDTSFFDYTVLPEIIYSVDNQFIKKHNKTRDISNLIKTIPNRGCHIFGVNQTVWRNRRNLVLLFNQEDFFQKRHKQILVPFAEDVIFPSISEKLEFVKNNRPEPCQKKTDSVSLFYNKGDTIFAAVCYEGFFENFLKKHLIKAPEVIFIVAKVEFEHNNHFNKITKLLNKTTAAIFQKYIVKASWRGSSYIINPKGDVEKNSYNENSIIEQTVFFNKNVSFFARCKINIIVLLSFVVFILALISKLLMSLF